MLEGSEDGTVLVDRISAEKAEMQQEEQLQ